MNLDLKNNRPLKYVPAYEIHKDKVERVCSGCGTTFLSDGSDKCSECELAE